MRIPIALFALAAASVLAGCGGGSSDKAASAYSKDDFNKNFLALMAAEPGHFQDILGEKEGSEGIVGIFRSKIALPGTTDCRVKNTADDKSMVICDQGTYDTIDEAKKAYATIKAWAIAAMPSDAESMEQNGDPDIPFRYVVRYKGSQAQAAVAKDDDTKKFDVGFVFSKPV